MMVKVTMTHATTVSLNNGSSGPNYAHKSRTTYILFMAGMPGVVWVSPTKAISFIECSLVEMHFRGVIINLVQLVCVREKG